jgi:DNA-binding transcriptional ArsR family regulator
MANLHAPSSLDAVFRALADPTRRAVLSQLSVGRASVSELARDHRMALPTFLRHLGVLEEGGLIVTRKRGRVRTCELREGGLEPAQDWIGGQRRAWLLRLDRLGEYLGERETDNQ